MGMEGYVASMWSGLTRWPTVLPGCMPRVQNRTGTAAEQVYEVVNLPRGLPTCNASNTRLRFQIYILYNNRGLPVEMGHSMDDR